ncbi:MAG: hypothetical protein V4631_23415 [Pseudomonadota bacterium]
MPLPTNQLAAGLAMFALSASAATSSDSCIGNFCLYKPLTEKQFVHQYGRGEVRRDDYNTDVRYRCFYERDFGRWVQFQFSNHGAESAHLEAVMIGKTELCSARHRTRRPMNLRMGQGIALGMKEGEVIEKLGRPTRKQPLVPEPHNSIFDSRYGDHALVYETDHSLLLSVVYLKDGKVTNYLISNSE